MGVNYFFPANQKLGYGIHAQNLISEYYKLDNKISATPINQISDIMPNVKKAIENDFDLDGPSIMIWHAFELHKFYGKTRIGFPVFEQELNKRELNILKTLDRIFVVSKWAKDLLQSQNVKQQIDVVPEGFNPEIYFPIYKKSQKLERIGKKGITFIHVGKWEERKRTRDIIKAFDVGTEGHRARLICHCFSMFCDYKKLSSELLHSLNYSQMQPGFWTKGKREIIIPQGQIRTFEEVAKMYNNADFGLFFSKAEGWNLPLCELLACGVPCITTRNTGMTEYLLDTKLTVKTKEDLIAKIRMVSKNPDKYIASSIYIQTRQFTWANAAKKLQEIL